ncbi:Las1-like-domain-containing protein [Naematelia encephala]|uniref:Las1-like-domain-containing protein n=1 Tax=Naematelia encephala TaxID=71784 RepID=A0A1Y2ATQ7_9TREE|nr:Las1-like-domain-containing protein [Naematelia encephala]
MRAPRRLPWASKTELSELYELLFAPSADTASRQRGVARMSVYISSPSCPAFIHLLHTLVAASLRPSPPQSAEESQSTRLAMAMAVVRFVNGMVDPLQTGPYARPISHIAASLGIPPSLVSLRHRATHEDLPPLPLLEQSTYQAIEYIHRYSFLPMLSSSSLEGPAIRDRRTKIQGLIGRWKRVMKERLREREVREDSESGKEMRRVRRALEAEDAEDVVEALCAEGALVPLARKKRPNINAVQPTDTSLLVWVPLLAHLGTSNPSIASFLADQILTTLLSSDSPQDQDGTSKSAVDLTEDVNEKRNERISFRWTLATWFLWIWTSGEAEQQNLCLDKDEKDDLWRRLMTGLIHSDEIVVKLYRSLLRIDPGRRGLTGLEACLLEDGADEELAGLEDGHSDGHRDKGDILLEMENRLSQLENKVNKGFVSGDSGNITLVDGDVDGEMVGQAEKGWRLVPENEWKPCPIGMWTSA